MSSKQRYSLSLTDDIAKKLKKMAQESKLTKSDIIRNAVGLYVFLFTEVREKHNKIVLRSEEDGKEKDRELIFKGIL